jgi:hypothetical protein
MAERQYKVYPDDVGSITAVAPTWRDSIRNILAESLGGERNNYRQAENLLSVGDFLDVCRCC